MAYWLFNIYCNEEEHGCTVFSTPPTKLRILFVAPFITSSVAWQIVNENMVNNIIDKDTKIFCSL